MQKFKCPNCGNDKFDARMVSTDVVHAFLKESGEFYFCGEIDHTDGELQGKTIQCRNCNAVIGIPELTVKHSIASVIERQADPDSHADYRIIEANDDYVFIDDLNLGNKSVTNDAEFIARKLAGLYPGRQIFYSDSEDNIDEILLKHGEFAGFKPVRNKDFGLK